MNPAVQPKHGYKTYGGDVGVEGVFSNRCQGFAKPELFEGEVRSTTVAHNRPHGSSVPTAKNMGSHTVAGVLGNG